MKIKYTFLLLFISLNTFAQSLAKINGKVVSNLLNTPLIKANVLVLNQKDSTIIKFDWTRLDGGFQLDKLPNGSFILLVTFPNYADYVEHFKLDPVQPIKNFNNITLISKVQLLNEVVIKGQQAMMKINGDTIEFNAKAFKIEPYDKVEDMIKQIPGMQVDRNGKITAYGQKVEKVLLDGEEFFGDDPTLITKNIRADMVDKIQLYDKKSEFSKNSGIADQNSIKTLNIKLKEDKKKGFFGKMSAGIGNQQYNQEQVMLNIFDNKKKFAIFGNTANTGKVTLAQSDNSKYGFLSQTTYLFGEGMLSSLISSTYNEFASERYNGQGFPSATTAGFHYDQKFLNDKHYINTNYLFGKLDVEGLLANFSKGQINDAVVSNNTNKSYQNGAINHNFRGSYDITLDSLSSLKINVGGNKKKFDNVNDFLSSSHSSLTGLLYQSERVINDQSDLVDFGTNAIYTKKFKKPRRSLALAINQYSYRNQSAGLLNVTTEFYNENLGIDSSQIINQFKRNDIKSELIDGTISFSEPLNKLFTMALDYGFGVNKSTAKRETYNNANLGVYSEFDREFSSDFSFQETSNKLRSILQINAKNLNSSIGLSISRFNFKQYNITSNEHFNRIFTNFAPQASFMKIFPKRGWLNFRYSGKPILPSVEQLQPIKVNEDPLRIRVGNPMLKPSFRNNIDISYILATPSIGRTISADMNFNHAINPFITSIVTDDAGKSVYQALNLTSRGISNFNLKGRFTNKIKKTDHSMALGLNYNYSNNYGFTNGVLLETISNIYTAVLTSTIIKANKYTLEVSLKPSYNQSSSSKNIQLNNSGYLFNGDFYLKIKLPQNISLTTNTSYNYQGSTNAYSQSNSILTINTVLEKNFFKNKSLRAAISGNDLLNQNKGFSRSVLGNYLNESTYDSIQRYFLLTLAWDFSKFGKSIN